MKTTWTFALFCTLLVSPTYAQTTELLSATPAGAAGSDQSAYTSISADGRFTAFTSFAPNLLPGDANASLDVFVRDAVADTTVLVSVDSAGTQGDERSWIPSISANGRFVGFQSRATNLVPGDLNTHEDIFRRDLLASTTIRVSVGFGVVEANSVSSNASVSADGNLVAFDSFASNLVLGDTNACEDVFVRDVLSGTTTRISRGPAGVEGDLYSYKPRISADGRFVAFQSMATNLVAGDTNGRQDVFVHDRLTGITELVSVSTAGTPGNDSSFDAAVSADGRFVAFASHATTLVAGDTNDFTDVFVRDRATGVTLRASIGTNGTQGDSVSTVPAISGDGSTVAFMSFATNFVTGDTNDRQDVFVHDLLTGVTTRDSVSTAGAQGNDSSDDPALSFDGRYLAFTSAADAMAPGDGNKDEDVFLRDRGGFTYVPFCFGDGSGTPCPCGNAGLSGNGCENSLGTGGGRLAAGGTPSVAADSVLLTGWGLPDSPALYFQASAQQNGGAGTTFGDGLRCTAGTIVRLGIETSVTGTSSHGAPAGDMPISVRGMVPPSGGVFHYQLWYRNAAPGFCTTSTFNLTNGLQITWTP